MWRPPQERQWQQRRPSDAALNQSTHNELLFLSVLHLSNGNSESQPQSKQAELGSFVADKAVQLAARRSRRCDRKGPGHTLRTAMIMIKEGQGREGASLCHSGPLC